MVGLGKQWVWENGGSGTAGSRTAGQCFSLKGGATVATEQTVATRSMSEIPKNVPRKVSDAPDKKETQHLEEGLQSKKKSDRWRGQTRITIGVLFPCWREKSRD